MERIAFARKFNDIADGLVGESDEHIEVTIREHKYSMIEFTLDWEDVNNYVIIANRNSIMHRISITQTEANDLLAQLG